MEKHLLVLSGLGIMKKTHQSSDIPFTQESNGAGCNGETKFTFRKNEFEITIFEGSLCENRFFYVLPYELSQKNDSTHVLTSDQLLRTNYSPTGQPDFSDIPLNIDQVELIIRSPNEFVTHLNLPNNPIFQDRIYTSSFIQYQRIQN